MNWKKSLPVQPCVLWHQFEIQIISHKHNGQGMCCSLCMECAMAGQRQRIHQAATLLIVGVNLEALLASPLCALGSLTLMHPCLSVLLVCAHWPQSTILAFSSCLHFPKSIYEGNFGCGYLKERRASGLVFCENTTSVYRALFVSPPAPFSVFSEDCPSVAWYSVQSLHWNDVHAVFIFLHDFTYHLHLCCLGHMWCCCDVGGASEVTWTNLN